MRVSGFALNRSRQAPAENTPAFGGIAERFRRGGDLDRAIALCREGLRKFPDLLSARVTLGWALLDKGLYDEAQAELEQVLRRAPDNLAAIRGLAELHDRAESAVPSMEQQGRWQQPETPPVPHVEAASAELPAPILASAVAEPAAEVPIEIQTAADAAVEYAEQLHRPVEALEPAALTSASAMVFEPTPLDPGILEVTATLNSPDTSLNVSLTVGGSDAEPAALDLSADDENLAGMLAELDGSDAIAASPAFLQMESSDTLEIVDAELAVAAALDAAAFGEPVPAASLQLSIEPAPVAAITDERGESFDEMLTFASEATLAPHAIAPSAAPATTSNVVRLETAAAASKAALASLDRFLAQVRTRRQQMESVA